MKILQNIVRYPIKGFAGEFLKQVKLISGSTIYGDRRFAFARHDTNLNQKSLIYMKKTNFLALVKDEKLALLKYSLDLKEEYLKMYFKKEKCFEGMLQNENDLSRLCDFMCNFLNINLDKKPKLIMDKSITKKNLKHSFSDIPDKAISFINLETIKDFEKKLIKKSITFVLEGTLTFREESLGRNLNGLEEN